MKVKVCGITCAEDAFLCEELGADALGFVHVPGRMRNLPLARIDEICSSVGPMSVKVLVCAPDGVAAARTMLERSGADVLQLHSLVPEEVSGLRSEGVRVIRSVPPERGEAGRFARCADALLFEGGRPGSGTVHDYSKVPLDVCERGIIAGGLTPSNLHEAKALGPYALDVSSGVEAVPGRKDPSLVEEFVRRCRE
jgi:phosphoribosylanthranilate isomerase